MEYEQGDVLLCTVEKITKTNVFVKIPGTNFDGSIVMSEIAPGRIRNIRDYVVPKKTICCKILKVQGNHLELSLRRVKEKEKKEILEQNKLEKSYRAVMKSILKEKTPEIVGKIQESSKLYDFLEEAKEDSKELEKLVGKENSEKILEILNTQKKKVISVKKEFTFTTSEANGLELIRETLGSIKGVEIKYLAAGKYSIKKEGENLKKADTEIREIIENLESQSKEKGFEIKLKH